MLLSCFVPLRLLSEERFRIVLRLLLRVKVDVLQMLVDLPLIKSEETAKDCPDVLGLLLDVRQLDAKAKKWAIVDSEDSEHRVHVGLDELRHHLLQLEELLLALLNMWALGFLNCMYAALPCPNGSQIAER